MSYRRTVAIHIDGSVIADDINLQLLDDNGDPVTAVFADLIGQETGGGWWTVTCNDVPNLHIGAIRVWTPDGADEVTLALVAVNEADDPCCAANKHCDLGAGLLSVLFCVVSAITGEGIEDVTVEVYADALRVDRVAVGVTDADGNVTLQLDPGTYWTWRYKDGLTFGDPQIRTVG